LLVLIKVRFLSPPTVIVEELLVSLMLAERGTYARPRNFGSAYRDSNSCVLAASLHDSARRGCRVSLLLARVWRTDDGQTTGCSGTVRPDFPIGRRALGLKFGHACANSILSVFYRNGNRGVRSNATSRLSRGDRREGYMPRITPCKEEL
jgi:hypothetical protein